MFSPLKSSLQQVPGGGIQRTQVATVAGAPPPTQVVRVAPWVWPLLTSHLFFYVNNGLWDVWNIYPVIVVFLVISFSNFYCRFVAYLYFGYREFVFIMSYHSLSYFFLLNLPNLWHEFSMIFMFSVWPHTGLVWTESVCVILF